LTDGERNLIATPEFLKRRYEEALAVAPDRDIKEATPMQALHRVRTYLRDALNPDHTLRSIQEDQKRFVEVFGMQGQESRDLLQKLGFAYSVGLESAKRGQSGYLIVENRTAAGNFQTLLSWTRQSDKRQMEALFANSSRTYMSSFLRGCTS
jgi:hypothetical protein